MILPSGWAVASRGMVCVAYRRCTVRDKLETAAWAQAWRDELALGRVVEDIGAAELEATCDAMAGRLLVWPDGIGWTPAHIRSIHDQDLALWAWLYGLLWAPVVAGAERLQSLASALQIAPTVKGGCPGDPASTPCEACLVTIYEHWDPPQHIGRPVCASPIDRAMGDAICQACPKFDATAGRPRPTLGAHDIELARLLVTMRQTGVLPDAGGLLDQDAETWDRLDLIARSPWFAAAGAHLGHE